MNEALDARIVSVKVNGVEYRRSAPVRMLLSDFLRHELRLTGTHVGCEHGVCGACTVLVDGRSARACLMLAVQAEGCEILTIEGIANTDGSLHPLQEAFQRHHALQCGFCTPGMLTTLMELLADNPSPTEEDVKITISVKRCRCTGYAGIVKAALDAAAVLRGEKAPAA